MTFDILLHPLFSLSILSKRGSQRISCREGSFHQEEGTVMPCLMRVCVWATAA